MGGRSLPRYFVASGEIPQPEASWPIHAIDNFIIGGRHLVERECIVTLDQSGNLSVVSSDHKGELSDEIQAQLAYNEVSGGTGRLLSIKEVFLFKLDLLEQTADAPGVNDPVHLHGTLYGSDLETGVSGQFTVTRADLLEGIVGSARYAFRPSPPAGTGANRCFNIMLPGDREEQIAAGTGVILAYPLLPTEIAGLETTNEALVAKLLYDILLQMQVEMRKQKMKNTLVEAKLPLPNGPEVVDTLLAAAAYTLNDLNDWPSSRCKVLRAQVSMATPEVRSRAVGAAQSAPPRAVHVPKPTNRGTGRPTSPYAEEIKHRALNEPPDWMNDFVDEKPRKRPPPAPSPSPAPDWMSDFE